ncbi:unnamed protein product [Paramecium primaurelia]|uniref:Uncharacterized protein n=1 Tax=Paramecium primaurelia TaxID=5886 RepID=A0A8S1KX94_PARPR|nr:unnamed protein product [Paramecium primaurelia]CAD8058023.1 unnamed protein product [Paramecium primaurelia]
MKLLILFFLIEFSKLSQLPAPDANAKSSSFNGALLLQSERITIFRTPGIDNNPLRNLLYYYPSDPKLHQGHAVAIIGESIIVKFQQAYEINTVRFWMLDVDGRITDLQVLAIAADRKTEKVNYDGLAPPNLNIVRFSDQSVSGLKFYNRGGESIHHLYMSIIKIQVFYAF